MHPYCVVMPEMLPSEKDYDKLLVLYRDLEFRNLIKELEEERPADLFSENLFDMASESRPFELFMEVDTKFLKDADRIALLSDENNVYIADEHKRCIKLSFNDDADKLRQILSDESLKKQVSDLKALCHLCMDRDIALRGVVDAVEILAYLDDSD